MIKSLIDSYENQPFVALLSYDEPRNNIICSPDEATKFGIKFKFDAKNSKNIDYKLEKFPISFEKYKASFDKLRVYQENGENEILNLCFPTKISSNLSLDEIYKHANAKAVIYKKDDFVCFTPEPFVIIEDDFIHAFPMKGTIDASLANAKEILLNDTKEIDEQKKMVKFMSNDLMRVCDDVSLERFRYIQRVGNLYQTSSHLKGKIKDDLSLGEIFAKILPVASIAGSPKDKALKIIKECEIENRGFYTGVFVHFDGKVCKSYVLIRFIKQVKDELFYFSGGGITLSSDARKEYDELIKKVYLPFWNYKASW